MDQALSLSPPPEQQQPAISMDAGVNQQISPDIAQQRAFKVSYGLGDILKKSQQEIYGDLMSGQEPTMRAQVAADIDYRKSVTTNNAIAEFAKNKGSNLTSDDMNFIRRAVGDLGQNTDPSSVFEQGYAKEYLASLDRLSQRQEDNVLTKAQAIAPTEVAKSRAAGEDFFTRGSYVKTLEENNKDERQSQGWGSYLLDVGKTIIPGGQSYMAGGIFPGEAFANKAINAWSKPTFQEFKKQVDTDLAGMNPLTKASYIEALKGMSTNDRTMNDMAPFFDLAALPIEGKAAKFLGNKLGIINEQKTAIRTALTEMAAAPEHSPSVIAASIGDLPEAGIKKTTANIVADMHGATNPLKQATEGLTSALRTDNQAILQDVGRAGQEVANRIAQDGDTIQSSLLDKVQKVMRVARLGEVLSSETVARAVRENFLNTYVGLRNRVLDQSPFYRVLDNHYFDMIVGDSDAKYFSSRQTAEAFAENNRLGNFSIETKEGVPLGPEKGLTATQLKEIESKTKSINLAESEAIPKLQKIAEDETQSLARRQKAQEDIAGFREVIQRYQQDISKYQPKTSVNQQGLGYYIRVPIPLNETLPDVRKAVADWAAKEGSDTYTPKSLLNSFIGQLAKFRTPEENLSLAQRANRKIATEAPSIFKELLVENAQAIKKLKGFLPNSKWKDFQAVVEHAADHIDPATNTRGYFFKTIGELENFYQHHIKRLPDPQEIEAYFAFKRGMELDRVFRNMAEHRNQLRVGAQTHEVFALDKDGDRTGSGKFSGVAMDHYPGGEGKLLVMGDKLGEEKMLRIGSLQDPDVRKMVQQGIEKGYGKVIEIYNPELRPFQGFGAVKDDRIRYVYVPNKNLETNALTWDLVPRRGGGHVLYDHEYYIKQPNIAHELIGDKTDYRHWYEGDRTLMAVSMRQIGKDYVDKLNQIRLLLRAGKRQEAMDFANSSKLGVSWDEINSWFNATKNEKGVTVPPRYSMDEEFRLVPKGKQIIDLDDSLVKKYGSNFRDGTKSGSLARQFQVEFTGQRDADNLMKIENEGSRYNPDYKISPADKLDSISVMNRALHRIIGSNYMDDYKIFSVEHWLAEAKPWLRNSDEIYGSPFWHFMQKDFIKGSSETKDIIDNLKVQHAQIQSLLGIPSEVNAQLHSISEKLADSIYSGTGFKTIPKWVIPFVRDPTKVLRSLAVNETLGLFNIPQFIAQSMNFVNVMAISPRASVHGILGSQLHMWSNVNRHPEVLARLDDMATKLSLPGIRDYKPGEFTEAFNELEKTGFGISNRQFAALDDMFGDKVVTSAGRTFLDWGMHFFKAGDRNAKYIAWYTAMKEFRDLEPTKVLTDIDRAKILNRADDLNANMSRASSSMLNKGFLSIPTQFFTYRQRLAELMFGKRLTAVEKARMLMANAIVFGVPTGIGVSGIPLEKHLRQSAIDNGYVIGESFLNDLVTNGLPASIIQQVAGFTPNIPSRLGTGGLDPVNDLLNGDTTFWKIASGVAGSKFASAIEQSDGVRSWMNPFFNDDEGNHYPVTTQDWVAGLLEINSAKSMWTLGAALASGKQWSKKEGYQSDIGTGEAIFNFLGGLQNQSLTDAFLLRQSMKDFEDKEKYVERRFEQLFNRWSYELGSETPNPEQAKQFMVQAKVLFDQMQYPNTKIPGLIAKVAGNADKSLLTKIRNQYFLDQETMPQGEAQKRLEQLSKTLQVENPENK